jgi:hypothetical protein
MPQGISFFSFLVQKMARTKQNAHKTSDGAKRKMIAGAKGKNPSLPRRAFGRIARGTVDDDGIVIRKTTVFKPATLLARKARRAQQIYDPSFTLNNTAAMSSYLVQQRIPGSPTSLSVGAVGMIRQRSSSTL